MNVPILKLGEYLIASVQEALTDSDLMKLREELLEMVGRYRTRGVVIDVSALDVMDSFSCRTLRDLSHALKLRGAEAIVVGIKPEVAFSMVQLGLSLEQVMTGLNLEDGLACLDERMKGNI
jgi:rsbT antagonist protein RsbS